MSLHESSCRVAGLALAAWLIAAPAPAAEVTDSLEAALVRQAPALIRHFQERNCRNVGVLKFLVSIDGQRPHDCVGTLNMLIARRLEVALVLANDPRRPVGIVGNASAVAARTPGANHRTSDGRRILLGARYPLAYGQEEVTADAFVTGLAVVGNDLRTLSLALLAFDRKDRELRPLGKDFVARTDPLKLGEMGTSFVLRRVKDDLGDEGTPAQMVDTAASVLKQKTRHPLEAGMDRPVDLEVRYDGEPVTLTFRDGRAYLPSPREGQKVKFVLRRDRAAQTYGVVLKVNGENTLFRQREPDLSCRRWVLSPGASPLEITGYQIDEDSVETFRVLSPVESKEQAMNYGEQVGMITLTVFRAVGDAAPPTSVELAAQKVAAVRAAQFPTKPAANLHALKQQLLQDCNRGLIVGGERVDDKVRQVPFLPDPTPLMTVSVHYYQP